MKFSSLFSIGKLNFSFFIFIFICCFVFGKIAYAQLCDTVVNPTNKPAATCASTWPATNDGACVYSETSNYYKDIYTQIYKGACSPSSSLPLPMDGYTRSYCQSSYVLDDPNTPANEASVRVIYTKLVLYTCPQGYSLSYGKCNLVGACPQPTQPTVCQDGFPPEAGQALGYSTCDRPPIKQCSDNTFVLATNFCTTVCADYGSCLEYAKSHNSCPAGDLFVFNYQDPDNFSSSCTTIASDSPDNMTNGGNYDGNPFNDPNSPTATGSYSSPSAGDIDPQSLASYIDTALQDNFDALERAQRDTTKQSKQNTNSLQSSLNDLESTNSQGFNSLGNAVGYGASAIQGSINNLNNSLNSLAGQLGQSSNNSGNDGPCNPKSPDYYTCMHTPMNNLPSHTSTSNVTTIEQANANFKLRIGNSPIFNAFSGMSNLINISNAQCPDFSFDLRGTPVNDYFSTTIHCDLMESIRPLVSSVMMVIYVFIGFRIFASA